MQVAPIVLIVVFILGVAALGAGVAGLIRDGRRLATPVYLVVGLGLLALGVGLLMANLGNPRPLITVTAILVGVVILGNLLGYPLLVFFLLYAGMTVLRRESRTVGNALALLAGVGLLLPLTLGFLAPKETEAVNIGYQIRYALHLMVLLTVAYFGFTFASFLAASWLYRWRGIRTAPEAVIVLGAGLVNGKVSPLLADRLDRGLAVYRQFAGQPVMIPSGGQGKDEPIAEGAAMADYLKEHGVTPDKITPETQSRNTEENLRFSSKLLDQPSSQVVVATSSYHVFRAALLTRTLGMRAYVVGASTAWYYYPSALLREFVGVIRDRMKFTVFFFALIALFSVTVAVLIVPSIG